MTSKKEPKKEKRVSFEKNTFEKKDIVLRKCGNVVGRINLKTM